jgi:hypothetical protein
MKISLHAKIAGILAAIVLVSGFIGGLIGQRLTRQEMRQRFNPERWNDYAMRTLQRRLSLTEPQQAKIQIAIDQAVKEMKAVHQDTVRRTREIVYRMLDGIDSELTPEQKRLAEKLVPTEQELTIDLLKVKPRD